MGKGYIILEPKNRQTGKHTIQRIGDGWMDKHFFDFYHSLFSPVTISARLVLILLMINLSGCLPATYNNREAASNWAYFKQNDHNAARISCFLTLKDDRQGVPIRMEVDSFEISADDLRQPIISKPLKLDSAAIGDGQVFLGSVTVPPGNYNRLRMRIIKGEALKSDGTYTVISQKPFEIQLNLPESLALDPADSRTLHIIWDVKNSLRDDNTFMPDVTAFQPLRQMLINLIFVSSPDIDTIFVVRPDKNWVVDSFGLKGGPTYLAISSDERQHLYVLASRERMIKVVDLSSYRLVNFFPAPLDDEPTHMTISPDGQYAYLLDELNGYLSRMDLATGQNIARVLIGYQPKYAIYLEEQNLLAVSLSLAQKVLLLNPETLSVVRTVPTGSSPLGLAVSENLLLIAEYTDNSVSFIDLANIGSLGRLMVGFGPHRLQPADDQVYVSNYKDGSLSVLVPGQLGVISEIYGLGRPREMVFDQFYGKLYVTNDDTNSLIVIDTNSNKPLGQIFLGARPFGMYMLRSDEKL